MGLIKVPKYYEYNSIQTVVYHLSKFGFVHPFKIRISEDPGIKPLPCILSSRIMPNILQSDNGGFLIIILPFFGNSF